MFRVEVSTDLSGLLSDETHWNSLARGVPFRETSWLAPWWQHFGADQEAYVLVARGPDDEIRGILPFYHSAAQRTRSLSVIGDGQTCSDHVSVLAKDEDAVEVARAMGTFLVTDNHEYEWDAMSIDGVVEGDEPMAAFTAALKEGGAALHAQSRMSTWHKPVDASWDEHLKHFGKTQRRKMRRWSEKVQQIDGLEKNVATTEAEVETSLRALIDLHQRRWVEAGEPGSYADPKFRLFVEQSTLAFFRRGRLYLPTLAMNDRVIGGELHWVGGDQNLYCYSSGYDLDSAELEPGRILAADTLMHLYSEQLAGIDYLRGDEPYKKRMAANPRRVFHLRAVAPALLPRLRHAAWCTGFGFKQWMRRQTGRKAVEVVDPSRVPTHA